MKKYCLILFVVILLFSACSRKAPLVKAAPDTPAYTLGKELAKNLPALDPDSNTVLVSTKKFDVSAGEMLQYIASAMGNQTDQIIQMPKEKLRMTARQVAEQVATNKLLLDAAKKKGYKASEADVDSVLAILYQRFGGKEKYFQLLSENGLDMTYLRSDITKNVIITDYLEAVRAERTAPTDAELKAAYEESLKDTLASVRHILLLTQGKSPAEKETIHKKMEGILAKAKAGEDFAELAKEYSEDPGSKDNGGLYENFGRGTMVKPFEDAAFTVPVGNISDIVETTYGYHILQIVSRGPNTKTFEESRPELEQKLSSQKGQKVIPDFIEEVKKKADFKFVGW